MSAGSAKPAGGGRAAKDQGMGLLQAQMPPGTLRATRRRGMGLLEAQMPPAGTGQGSPPAGKRGKREATSDGRNRGMGLLRAQMPPVFHCKGRADAGGGSTSGRGRPALRPMGPPKRGRERRPVPFLLSGFANCCAFGLCLQGTVLGRASGPARHSAQTGTLLATLEGGRASFLSLPSGHRVGIPPAVGSPRASRPRPSPPALCAKRVS